MNLRKLLLVPLALFNSALVSVSGRVYHIGRSDIPGLSPTNYNEEYTLVP
ncbi:MAG: hypothetical protein ACE5H0_14045 [Bacteroidota bacterium]